MRIRLNAAATVALLVAVSVTVGMAKTKVKAQKDPNFDFSKLKTWAWNPSGPGDVKVWVTAESKSEPVKRTYEPTIIQSVESELAKLGFAKATGPQSDFKVTYYVLVTVGSSSQEMGQFLPAVAQWGVPPFAPQTTSLEIYPTGSFVLDVASPDPSRVVWRAVAQSEIDLDRTESQRKVRIQSIVHDILEKLPRK